MTIRKKIIIGLVFIDILILIGAVMVGRITDGLIQEAVSHDQTLVTKEISLEVDRRIHSRIQEIRLIALTPLIKDTVSQSNSEFAKRDDIDTHITMVDERWSAGIELDLINDLLSNEASAHLQAILQQYQTTYNYSLFGELFITNRHGANIALTNRTSDYFQADEKWWQEASQQGVFVGEMAYDESAESYSIDIGIRIDDVEGKFIGVIKAVLDIREIESIVAEMANRLSENVSHVHLITHDGDVIYSSVFLRQSDIMSELFYQEILADTAQQRGSFAGHRDDENILFAFNYATGYRNFSGLQWIMITEQPLTAVLTTSRSISIVIGFTVGFIIVLSFFLGWLLVKSILQPIIRLQEAANVIAKGDFTKRVTESNDEIGICAIAFNRMTEQLQTIYDQLEKKVINRTKDVAQANTRLKEKIEELEKFEHLTAGREVKMIELKEEIQRLKSAQTDNQETS